MVAINPDTGEREHGTVTSGLATAKAFAAEGCRIMLSARSAEQLREAETEILQDISGKPNEHKRISELALQ
jgi:NADP-dependent 3-hydroxy acid dehydrogenase YdfG